VILIDAALARLAAEDRTIRVGVVGAGFMVEGLALQLAMAYPQIRIVGIAARRPEEGRRILSRLYEPGSIRAADSSSAITRIIASGAAAITDDPVALAAADGFDLLLEGTGSMDFALAAVLAAIEARKDVVLMNAELDATVGPMLKVKADQAGVVITNIDGDQPGVEMNLYRYVSSAGFKPMLCGSVKTLQDQHRTPATQAAFAARWTQKAEMVTSFADGSKVAFEQAVVANATGMRVAKRGMIGYDPTGKDPSLPLRPLEDYVERLTPHLDPDLPGLVDFVVGARPSPGVFVIGYSAEQTQQHYMAYYKMGPGPYYLFYTPYHLVHLEVPLTIARVALFRDAAVTPIGPPRVGVVATAKRPLSPEQTLDGIGGFDTYGEAENISAVVAEGLLPMALAHGCIVARHVRQDATLTWDDVKVPSGRLIDKVYAMQMQHFKLAGGAQ